MNMAGGVSIIVLMFIFFLFLSMCICVDATLCEGALGGQTSMLDSLELLELQAGENHLILLRQGPSLNMELRFFC